MPQDDDILEYPSAPYVHIDPMHKIFDYKSELTVAEGALLNRLCHQVYLSPDEWAELDRMWQRMVRG